MKKKLLNTLIILSLVLTTTNCKGMEKDEKYDWSAEQTSVKNYPVFLITGGGETVGGEHIPMPGGGFVTESWGGGGAVYAVGDDYKTVPKSIYAKWYSVVEDKFYIGEYDLPVDTITHLFEEGFISAINKKPITYNVLMLGFAPGGKLIVLLRKRYNKAVEIGVYQGLETQGKIGDLDYEKRGLSPQADREAVAAFRRKWLTIMEEKRGVTLDSLKQIPPDLYTKTYRKRFPWRPVMDYDDKQAITDDIYMEFLNCEADYWCLQPLAENKFALRARPLYMKFYWSSGRLMRESKIWFDKKEILEAYRLIYENCEPTMQSELCIQVNKANDHIRIFLRAVGTEYPKEIELRKAKIHIYDIEEARRRRYTVFKDEYEDKYPWNRKDGKDTK